LEGCFKGAIHSSLHTRAAPTARNEGALDSLVRYFWRGWALTTAAVILLAWLAWMRAQESLLFATLGATLLFLAVGGALGWRTMRQSRAKAQALAGERLLLLHLIDSIPESIFVKDLRGCYVLDNEAHRRFLGVATLEAVVGRSVFDFFPSEMASLYDADDRLVLRTGNPVLNREEPAVTREGKLIWLSTTKVPLNDLTGMRIGLVCVSADISERKAAEEKMRVFAAQLERSNRELQDFAGVASHDLQEPLRKIRAFAGRLRSRCGAEMDSEGLDYLERMEHAAGRMQALVQDLLTLARVSSKGQPFEPVDLAQVVREVLSDLEVAIDQSAAIIEVGRLPTIDADPIQMRQLFQNLLTNALKFHKPGQRPEVSIDSKNLIVHEQQIAGASPGEEVCQIVVADNGIGFEEQFAEQIFAVFQRLHTQREYAGTGIGLAVCRRIANRHGGSIVAKSAKGQGATFIVVLPACQKGAAATL
jgi:PAS domain S-box-containing protein